MLQSITIRNFALIHQLELDFRNGLTVLTGETGAGKSIIIDAVSVTLGKRANNNMVRRDAERAEISTEFDISNNHQALAWLKDHELENGLTCMMRRVLKNDGSSRAYINGSPIPLAKLKSLGSFLLDIHGQHEHQRLTLSKGQMSLLDSFGQLAQELSATEKAFIDWQACQLELGSLEKSLKLDNQNLDLLAYQVEDLNRFNSEAGEYKRLCQHHDRLSAADQLISTSSSIINSLEGDNQQALINELSSIEQQLTELSRIDPELQSPLELVATSVINLQEANREIKQFADGLTLDAEQLDTVSKRLEAFHDLARKHRIEPSDLHQHTVALQSELAIISNADERLQDLRDQLQRLQSIYDKSAKTLSKARNKAAKVLSEKVSLIMQQLAMDGGKFFIRIAHNPDKSASLLGKDTIEFEVSASAGQDSVALRHYASGGELARISLAIQVATLSVTPPSTMIFDEVDTGVGGAVAEMVGEKLRHLSQRTQVICITHLPQVAAQGHHHLLVHKSRNKSPTETSITSLTNAQRTEELARMLGGKEITKKTRDHANELLNRNKTAA